MFMDDLASRLAGRIQLPSDGHKLYLEAVEVLSVATWTMPNCSNCRMRHRRGCEGGYSLIECIGERQLASVFFGRVGGPNLKLEHSQR